MQIDHPSSTLRPSDDEAPVTACLLPAEAHHSSRWRICSRDRRHERRSTHPRSAAAELTDPGHDGLALFVELQNASAARGHEGSDLVGNLRVIAHILAADPAARNAAGSCFSPSTIPMATFVAIGSSGP